MDYDEIGVNDPYLDFDSDDSVANSVVNSDSE